MRGAIPRGGGGGGGGGGGAAAAAAGWRCCCGGGGCWRGKKPACRVGVKLASHEGGKSWRGQGQGLAQGLQARCGAARLGAAAAAAVGYLQPGCAVAAAAPRAVAI